MNKRIEELKGKALDQAVPYTWHHLNQVQIDDVMNKLAELIIKECAGVAQDFVTVENNKLVEHVHISPWHLQDKIKEHFGVE